MLVDQMALVAFGDMLEVGIQKDQADIFRYAGQEFNINSPKQLGEVLFERLGLPPVKKTKSGYSTNAEVLEKLIRAATRSSRLILRLPDSLQS